MINKVKEFINMRESLKTSGVIGVSMFYDEIHVKLPVLLEMPNVQFESFNDSDYPFKAFATEDGITFYALIHKDDVKNFPQLEMFVIEDVNLTGSVEDEAF